jgi:MYXO-CTERM domain-containing protein
VKLCLDSGCEGKTCGANTHCAAGECVDDCDGSTCPQGQLCSAGECVADPNGPVGTGGTGVGGNFDPGVGGTLTFGGSSNSGGKGTSVTPKPVTTEQKSCNCSVPGGTKAGGSAALLLAGMLALSRRRRRA